jgi:hypothetical protein
MRIAIAMGQDDRQSKSLSPDSMPPEMVDIDSSWDDDHPLDDSAQIPILRPESDNDAPFDRVTSAPDPPPNSFAARMLAEAPPGGDNAVEFDEPELDLESGLHERQTPVFDLEPDPLLLPELPREPPSAGPELGPGLAFSSDLPPALGFGSSIPMPEAPAQGGQAAPAIEIDELSLEEPVAPPEADPAVSDMKDRYATGDFTGALVIAESILESDPDDLEAKRYAESCREVLTQMYASRLGSLDQVVVMAIPADQVRWLSLDHRAGFLLSLVDGASSVEELLDISGMPRLDALRLLFTLLEQRVIALEST